MNITSDDPRLTAYALGELDEAERSLIKEEMRTFDECRCEVEEITRAAALVRAGLALEPVSGLTLTQQRAVEAKLALSGSKPKLSLLPSAPNEGLSRWRLKIVLAVIAVLLIRQFAFPTVLAGRALGFLSHATAGVAYGMIRLAGTTVIKNGLQLTSSRLAFEVAPSCEANASTLSLLVASLLIGSLFLRSPWRRLLLPLFVIPMVMIREGLRIFLLVELCAHRGASALDSPIYNYGSPILSALFLIPFICFLVWLRKLESKS